MFDITKPFVYVYTNGCEYPARLLGKLEGQEFPLVVAYQKDGKENITYGIAEDGTAFGQRLKNLPVIEETWQNFYPESHTAGSQYKTEEICKHQVAKTRAGFRVYTKKEDGVIVKREIVGSWE